MTIDYYGTYPYTNRTLAEMRQSLMIRLGFSAQLAYPPAGMPELLNEFLRDAQVQLLKRDPGLRNECWFTWTLINGQRFYTLNGNDERNTIAAPTTLAVVYHAAGGSLPAASYSYRVTSVNAYGESLASTAVAGTAPAGSAGFDLSWSNVTGATSYNVYGRIGGNERLLVNVVRAVSLNTWTDNGSIGSGTVVVPTANTTYTRNATLDPERITYAGITRGTQVYPMRRGINEGLLAMTTTSSIPYAFEVRQALEVWPIPTDALSKVLIRGHQLLGAFSADTDRPSIDENAVFLMALAGAKEHYGQNASSIWRQFEVYLGKLVHGAHAGRRYIPGDERIREWPMPVGTFR